VGGAWRAAVITERGATDRSAALRALNLLSIATNEEIRYITVFAKRDRMMSGPFSRATLIQWRKYRVHS